MLCDEWDYTKNDKGPENYSHKSSKKVCWKCCKDPCGCHTRETSINNRHKNECPYCSGNRVCSHYNLTITNGDLCREWDYDRNPIGPESFSHSSSRKVWWNCLKDKTHDSWCALISNRTRGSACPTCNLSKVEKSIDRILKSLDVKYERQYTNGYIVNRQYDFYMEYRGSKFLIEYDGEQHFEDIEFFNRKYSLDHRQKIDRIKTYAACITGYNLIRIDYINTTDDDIKNHLLHALELNGPIYYSNPEMYEWLSNSTLDMDLLARECPELYNRS